MSGGQGHWNTCEEFRTAWKVAWLLASVIMLLKYGHLLERIEMVTLNAVAAKYATDERVVGPEKGPEYVFLRIDQANYEENFAQSSPLDRLKLTALLQEFEKLPDNKRPPVIAIDLDLSPNPRRDGEPLPEADRALAQGLKNLAAKGVNIVLPIPFPVGEEKNIRQKADWVEPLSRCTNIRFGLPSIFAHDGVVMNYFDAPSSFSHATCEAAMFSGSTTEECTLNAKKWKKLELDGAPTNDQLRSKLGEYLSPQEVLLVGPLTTAATDTGEQACQGRGIARDRLTSLLDRTLMNGLFRYLSGRKQLDPYLYPFNYQLIDRTRDHVITIPEDRFPELDAELNWHNKVVLIGADYGATDFYQVVGHQLTGSQVHLAAFASILDPITVWPKLAVYGAEIVSGLVTGLVFAWFFHKYLQSGYHTLWLLVNVAVIGLAVWALAQFAYWLLLNFKAWLNPGPLVFGLLLHQLFGRFEEAPGQSGTGEQTPQGVWRRLRIYSDKPLKRAGFRLIVGCAFAAVLWESRYIFY